MVSIFARKKPCQNWLWKTAHLNRKDKSKSKGSRLALTLVYSPRSANRSSHFSFFSNSAIIGSVGAFCFFPLIIINGCCQLPSCVCVCVAEAIRSLEASTRVGLLIRRCCVYVCQEKGGVETGRGMGETVLAPDLPVCWPLQSFASLGCVRIRRSTGRHIFFSVSLSPFPPTTFCFTLLHFASQHLDITGENKSNLNFFFFQFCFVFWTIWSR